MNRRKTVISLLGCGCLCGRAFSQSFPRAVERSQVAAVARGCGIEPGGRPRPARLASCGVSELDSNIELELAFLRKVFNVSPSFYFGKDDPEHPVAGTYRNSGGDGDSTVILGINFIQREIRLNPHLWQPALIGVIAHEWAHALQYISHLQDRQFMWETHADFMSGWYLGVKRKVGNWQIQPSPLAKSLFVKGTQSDFYNADTHGVADVRVAAMLEGYNIGLNGNKGAHVDVYDAANLGYLYAKGKAAR